MTILVTILTAAVILAVLYVAWPWLRLPRTEDGGPDLTALALMAVGPSLIAGCPAVGAWLWSVQP